MNTHRLFTKALSIWGIKIFRVLFALIFATSMIGVNPVSAAPAGTALNFDGTNDYVTFGAATGLRLTNFTLESWIKRTGAGTTMNTAGYGAPAGTGIIAVPLITKGRCTTFSSGTHDMNYFFGIDATGHLAADFEDTLGKAHHPVTGVGTIAADNTWHHVAATYDVTSYTWNLYLDGNLDQTLTLASLFTPNNLSVLHSGIGAGLGSTGSPTGACNNPDLSTQTGAYFQGVMDETRIWSRALSQTEIHDNMYSELTSGTGLVARWGMAEGTGTTIASSIGTFPGTLTNGPTWVTGFPDNDPPAKPSGLSATPGNTTVALNWTANTDPDLAGYNLYRGIADGGPYSTKVNSTLLTVTSTTDIGLTNGILYYYILKAVDTSTNESSDSDQASATPTGVTNTPPEVTNPGSQTNAEGNTVSLQIVATDADMPPQTLAYSAANLPTGLSISPTTGLISGTITYHGAALSPYSSSVTVTDGTAPVTVNFTWTVTNVSSGLCGSDPTLVGCWQMEEGSGPILIDASSFGNDANLTGSPTFTTGKIGTYALSLNGSSQYGVVPDKDNSLDVTTAVTLAAWIKPNHMDTQRIIAKAIMGSTDGYELSLSSAQKVFVRLNQKASSDTYRINSTSLYPIDGTTWMHVAATYDGTNIRLYINGVQEGGDKAMAGGIAPNGLDLAIGYESPGATTAYYYQGAMDDARVYNRALSLEEIQALAGVTPTCYALTLNHTGQGSTPTASPSNSSGCAAGEYISGENISLSGAAPTSGWAISSWYGTLNNPSTANTNSLTMPPSILSAGVNYTDIAPAAPTGLTAVPGNTSVTLSWTANSEGDLAGYNLYRGEADGGPYPTKVNSSLLTGTTTTDTGLTNGTTYYYVLKAVDTSTNESLASNQASATPVGGNTPPAAPIGLTATPGNTTVTLNWTANGEGDLAGYNIYRSTTSPVVLTSPINGVTLVTGTTYRDTGLTNGQIYYYIVTAVDTGALESGASNEVNATPVAYALHFSGANTQYVSFGQATSTLGAAQFTLELWFRRTAAGGVTVSTGTGGVTAYPLLTKGMAEADASDVDCNYFLGIRGTDNVLVADFEDMTNGLNHPIAGVTALPATENVWHHAAATYNGSQWQLFLDGKLEAEMNVGKTPRWDSRQYAGLGTAMTSTGVRTGFFLGDLDEARIWNYARTQAEILSTLNVEIASPDPSKLLGYWKMNEGSGNLTDSSTHGVTGIVTGATWLLNAGFPINVDTTAPATITGLAATAGDRLTSLTWTANSEIDLRGYNVYRSTGTPVPTVTPINGSNLITTNRYVDGGLTNGIPYYYVVTAVDSSGNASTAPTSVSATPASATGYSMQFNGNSNYVTYGRASRLGVETFTVEGWFKRMGAGVTADTGAVAAEPLFTKGRGEADGSNVDMNYFIGIRQADGFLVADFEDGANGANHPIIGTTSVADGAWHHVALAYEPSGANMLLKLYLDGGLQSTVTITKLLPRSDSIQHAANGSALNSTGVASGYFNGYIDEVRVWNYARSLTEINANKDLEILTAPG